MRFTNRHNVSMVTALLTVGVVVGCGKKKSSDDSSSSTSVSTLTTLPLASSVLSSTSTSLDLGAQDAVTGTPPKFVEIGNSDTTVTATNMEKYFTGTVATLISTIKAGSTFASIKDTVDKFRDGQTKCQVVSDAARSLQELASRTTSTCMMTKIGAAGSGALTYTSGDKVTDGEFFNPIATDVVRKLTLGSGGGDADTIIFNIQGTGTESGVFQIKLNFCKDSKMVGYDKIRVNNNDGTYVFTTKHSGSETRNNGTTSFKSAAILKAALKASGTSYVFDTAKDREMTIQNTMTSSTDSNSMDGKLVISGDTLSTTLFLNGSFTNDNGSQTMSSKSFGQVQFTGTNMSDAIIYQGAGRRVGSFTDPSSRKNTSDQSTGFEFDNTATPQYKTITSSTYITAAKAVDFATDTILKQTTPTAADVTDFADTACAQTAVSTYAMVQGTAAKAAKEACESKFSNGDRLCDTIRSQERELFDALRGKSGSTTTFN